MQFRTTFFSLFFVLILASSIFAQYSATESFNYPAGSSPDADLGSAGNGWAGGWYLDPSDAGFVQGMSMVASDGLLYDNLDYMVPNVGNHLQVTTPGSWGAARYFRDLAETWPDQAGTEYWISMLFQTDSIPNGNTYYIAKLYKDASAEKIAIGKGGGGTPYTCGSGWPGGAGDDVSSTECLSDPVWLVVKIVASGDSGDDVTYMWINPDPSSEPQEGDADVVRNTDINDGFNTVAVECGGELAMNIRFDEIRLGTSFEEVSSEISGSMYVQESFDYPAGSFLDALGSAGNGWAGGWFLFGDGANEGIMTVGDTAIVYDDLDYEVPHQGMQVSGANPVAWGFQRYGRYLDKNWPDEAGTTYWISFLCELDNGFTDNGWAGLGLFKDDTTEYRLLGHEWGNGAYGLATYGGETGYTSYRWDSGPVWIVTKIVMTGDTTAERAFMWVNIDPSDAEPDTSIAEAKASFGLNDGFDMVVVHFGGEGVGMTMAVDEIRIGTSWGDVSGALITGVEIPNNNVVPTEYALSQNYPNPFNPTTQLTFSVPQESIVTLKVYDIIGREVKVLVQSERKSAGTYQYSFDGSGLASGTYFYQLQTNDFVQTKKMLLIK